MRTRLSRCGRPGWYRGDRPDHERPGGHRRVHRVRGQVRHRVISIFAPAGIGEVDPQTDLAAVLAAVARDQAGPLADGDILVVTSKIVSKAENRTAPAAEREQVITAESVQTVARRASTRIVHTRTGLVLAAAGVDNSNVAAGTVLRLPETRRQCRPAAGRAATPHRRTRRGGRLRHAGRPWRVGQTDQAIGAAGSGHSRRTRGADAYGNQLAVTAGARRRAGGGRRPGQGQAGGAAAGGGPRPWTSGRGHRSRGRGPGPTGSGRHVPLRQPRGGAGGGARLRRAAGRVRAHRRAGRAGPRTRGAGRVGAEGAAATLLRAMLEADLSAAPVLSESR